jgi:hypothetical protein
MWSAPGKIQRRSRQFGKEHTNGTRSIGPGQQVGKENCHRTRALCCNDTPFSPLTPFCRAVIVGVSAMAALPFLGQFPYAGACYLPLAACDGPACCESCLRCLTFFGRHQIHLDPPLRRGDDFLSQYISPPPPAVRLGSVKELLVRPRCAGFSEGVRR